MNNGNGHTPPQIVAAQQALERAGQPLKKLNEEIAAAQLKLTAAERELNEAEAEHRAASKRFVADQSNVNRARLREASQQAADAKICVQVLTSDVAELEARRPLLQAEVDVKAMALAKVQRETRKQQIEDEINSAKFKLAQHQQACMEFQHRINTLADERLAITREEFAERDMGHREANEKFRRVNGPTPGFERTVRGF